MNAKEEFIQIYKENIHREGADAFLEFLEGVHSDFFTAPASTRFHGNMEGGLCEHSVHVFTEKRQSGICTVESEQFLFFLPRRQNLSGV